MQNFIFNNPTKIIFGRDTIPLIGGETAAFGKRVLFVYGRASIRKNGIYDQIMNSLHKAGLTVTEYGGVKSNPVLDHVRAGIALAQKNRIETVVAGGGGSVMDSAKAICAGAVVKHDVWKFFTGKKSVISPLPLTCVLTLAASGSEMNSAMVVTNEETRQKFGFANKYLYPIVSILDPTATFTVPPDYTAYGAVDAIAHVLEYYFTTKDPRTPVQDRLMEGLVVNIMRSCERIIEKPDDYQGRADLMWAATLALNGITGAGLGKVGFPMHLIEHSLSALYDIPHGAGLSVIIPGWMTHAAADRPARFMQFTERVFGITDGNTVEKAATGIKLLKAWFAKINSPTSLADVKVPVADIPAIAENAAALAKIWRMRDYTDEKIKAVLRLCL